MDDFKPGGFIPEGPRDFRDFATRHSWKDELIVPLNPTREQLAAAVAVVTFRAQIDLLDTSWLDEA